MDIEAGRQGFVETHEQVEHHCAIVGVYDPAGDPVSIAHKLLHNMNHRGQEGSMIAIQNRDNTFDIRGGPGWVSQAYSADDLNYLRRNSPLLAVGQNRYSTSGSLDTFQPYITGVHGFDQEHVMASAADYISEFSGEQMALAHNGNLTNAMQLLAELPEELQKLALNDTGVAFLHMIHNQGKNWQEKIIQTAEKCEGAFNFVIAVDGKIYAYRDPWGFRPLSIGSFTSTDNGKEGYVVASENGAFPSAKVKVMRDVLPGEGVVIDPNADTVQTFYIDSRTNVVHLAQCIFELIYFASPDSVIFGKPVSQIRRELGRVLARKDASVGFLPDVIVPVQHSGITYAEGYASEMIRQLLSHPEQFGFDPSDQEKIHESAASLQTQTALVANIYANGRSFIAPHERGQINLTKHRGDASVLLGKKKRVLIDDSIVRGGASKRAVKLLKDGETEGAQVHLRLGFGVRHPCYMGVDFATYEELIIPQVGEDGLSDALGADSVSILTPLEILEAVLGKDKMHELGDGDVKEGVIFQRGGYCGTCILNERFYPTDVSGVYRKQTS